MTLHFKDVAKECSEASHAERISFPQAVTKLMEAGVERYHADLVRSDKTYFMPGGENVVVPSPALEAVPAVAFSAAGVERAVRAIQRGDIQYRAFLKRIAEAGCVAYTVSLTGRRAVYWGRTGENYVEPFPAR